jgi:hypothetical protein
MSKPELFNLISEFSVKFLILLNMVGTRDYININWISLMGRGKGKKTLAGDQNLECDLYLDFFKNLF